MAGSSGDSCVLGHRTVISEPGVGHPTLPSYQGVCQDCSALPRHPPSPSLRAPFFFLQKSLSQRTRCRVLWVADQKCPGQCVLTLLLGGVGSKLFEHFLGPLHRREQGPDYRVEYDKG